MNNTIRTIVDFMVKEGIKNTTEGNYIFYFEELVEEFGIYFEYLQDNVDDIIIKLESRQEVLQVDYESNNSFSIYFFTDFCVNVESINEDEED